MVPNYKDEYKDEWLPHMRWPFQIFFLGWWLTGQFGVSGGETDQRPVISVSPPGMVPLGGSVTIHCRGETTSHVSWYFTKHDGEPETTVDMKHDQSCEVVFSIRNADVSNVGIYSCRHCVQEHCSHFSNRIAINLTDPNLPKPSIKMELQGKDTSGLNVSISCQGPKDGLTFALYKSREQIAFQTAKRKRNTTMFLVFMERPKDARNYSCQYHSKKNEFVWSEPSDPEELKVESESSNTGYDGSMILWAGIAAGLLLLFLLLLLFVLILHRKKRKGSFVKEKSQPVRKPSEPGGGEDPEEVSYAVLNHKSLQAEQMLSPGTASEYCIYASVVKK